MWEILKDLVAYIDWDTIDPLEIKLRDTDAYLASKGISPEARSEFRWIAPKNLWTHTVSPDGKYEQHYELNKVRRHKRAVVAKNSAGEIDLVLCRKALT